MPYGGSQLLELNLLSARDLAHVSKSMKTFAVAWINPDRKLETRPDNKGQNNPAWNEKFVFRLAAETLGGVEDSSSSAVNVEIYAMTRRTKVVLVGCVSVLVASLFPATGTPYHHNNGNNRKNNNNVTARNNHRGQSKMRFLTLQIRRPSGRPQGVLEIGVALLDGTRRSMPLSGSELSSSVAFADSELIEMDFERRNNNRNHHHHYNKKPIPDANDRKPKLNNLRRSKSERSISEVYLLKPAATESDSVISESVVNYVKGRASLSSDVGPSPSVVAEAIAMGMYQTPASTGNHNNNNNNSNSNHRRISAVEEAAESSILEDWVEEDDSVEGLKTKIERWRSEIHPLYQKPNQSSYQKNNNNLPNRSTYRKNSSGDLAAAAALAATPSSKRELRKGGSGLFSCFGTAYGCEFSITCGGGGRRKSEEEDAPVSISELHYGDQYV